MKLLKICISIILLVCLAIVVFFFIHFFSLKDLEELTLDCSRIENTYPTGKEGAILKRYAYHLSYNKQYKQANWTSYLLTGNMLKYLVAKRKNNFRSDNIVASATTNDYINSGYDRGHLVNAQNMRWSEKALDETFFMSNISPQKPEFNRGIWKKLENKVRTWAEENDSIIVVTGPYLDDIIEYIGQSKVAVPRYFFKIILDISVKDGYKAVGFWMENKKSEDGILHPLSVDEIEEKCKLNFFADQEPSLINHIESIVEPEEWGLNTQ